MLTLLHLCAPGSRGGVMVRIMRAGAAGLIPLGAATIVVTVRLARLTGDWEMYMIAAGLAAIAQGILTIWGLGRRAPRELIGV